MKRYEEQNTNREGVVGLGKSLLISFALLFAGWTGVGVAGHVSFVPDPPDLQDFPHEHAFTWGIGWSLPENCEITAAVLTIHEIYDWTDEWDILYVHLLDNPPEGVSRLFDPEDPGDEFSGLGELLMTYSDPDGPESSETLVHSFDPAELDLFDDYRADGLFGFGFDPDCHYYNSGIQFDVWYECGPPDVPEPGTLFLLGTAGAVLLIRRRRTGCA